MSRVAYGEATIRASPWGPVLPFLPCWLRATRLWISVETWAVILQAKRDQRGTILVAVPLAPLLRSHACAGDMSLDWDRS